MNLPATNAHGRPSTSVPGASGTINFGPAKTSTAAKAALGTDKLDRAAPPASLTAFGSELKERTAPLPPVLASTNSNATGDITGTTN